MRELNNIKIIAVDHGYGNSQPYTKDTTQENWNPWELFLTAAN